MLVIKIVRASFYVHCANCFFFLSFFFAGVGMCLEWGGGECDFFFFFSFFFFAGIDKDIEVGCKCEMNKQVGSLLQGPK